MKKIMKFVLLLLASGFLFTSCYSVFSGGTGGLVVDAESTSNPKDGIANVDVYAYTDSSARDSDFNNWKEGTVFQPSAEYYGHTTTESDGSFTISKLIWKTNSPTFWKDGDTETIYLIFYQLNYGLDKDQTIIVSDSTGNTVYKELKKIRTTMPLTLNFRDVKDGSAASATVSVEISVPQTNGKITEAEPVVFKSTITGSGTVNINYPRYMYDGDGNKSENTPEVTIKYYQTSEDVTWLACYNEDNEDKNYAFRDLTAAPVTKDIPALSAYSVILYGKACKLSYPSFSGIYHADSSTYGTAEDDGKYVSVKIGDTLITATDGTYATQVGTNGAQNHGNFSFSADSDVYIKDTSYTTKYLEKAVKFYINDGTDVKEVASSRTSISSKDDSYSNISLNDIADSGSGE